MALWKTDEEHRTPQDYLTLAWRKTYPNERSDVFEAMGGRWYCRACAKLESHDRIGLLFAGPGHGDECPNIQKFVSIGMLIASGVPPRIAIEAMLGDKAPPPIQPKLAAAVKPWP